MVMGVGAMDKDVPSLDGHWMHVRYKESGMRSIYKRMSSQDMVVLWTEATRGGVTHYLKRSTSSSSHGDPGLDTLLCVKEDVSALQASGISLRDKRFANVQFEASFFHSMEGADTDSDGE